MKASIVGILAAFGCALVLPSPAVRAGPPGLPSSVYPSGAHIRFQPVLSNKEMDCLWGFICEGGPLPNFHFKSQDQLHRTGGWAQFAGIQRHGRTTMAFQLFVSQYAPDSDTTGTPWSARALSDLRAALRARGYEPDERDASLLPGSDQRNAFVQVQRGGQGDLVVMALRSGDLEVEGIALYAHRSLTAKGTAWSSLALQMKLASMPGS